jgi:hypothetical protein
MTDKTPIDGEFGLDYQIFILRQMLSEMPEKIKESMLAQLDEVVKAVAVHQKLLISLILPKLEDVRLDVKYMEFDRQIIQQERDKLQEQLRNILGDDI